MPRWLSIMDVKVISVTAVITTCFMVVMMVVSLVGHQQVLLLLDGWNRKQEGRSEPMQSHGSPGARVLC